MKTIATEPTPLNPWNLDMPAWFAGPLASYQELHSLRERIHSREARVSRCLRRLFLCGLALVLLASLGGQYALAANDVALGSPGILIIMMLPLLCGLIIAGVHILELRFTEMADDGRYAIALEHSLRHVDISATTEEHDSVAGLILADARKLHIALAENRPFYPALIGEGLRLGH